MTEHFKNRRQAERQELGAVTVSIWVSPTLVISGTLTDASDGGICVLASSDQFTLDEDCVVQVAHRDKKRRAKIANVSSEVEGMLRIGFKWER